MSALSKLINCSDTQSRWVCRKQKNSRESWDGMENSCSYKSRVSVVGGSRMACAGARTYALSSSRHSSLTIKNIKTSKYLQAERLRESFDLLPAMVEHFICAPTVNTRHRQIHTTGNSHNRLWRTIWSYSQIVYHC